MERQLFIPTRGALDRVNRLLFRLVACRPTDSRPGFSDDDSFFNLPRHVAAGVGLANDTDSGQPRGQRLTTTRFLPHYRILGINGIRLN